MAITQLRKLAQEIAFDYDRSFDVAFIRRIELAIIGYRATIIRESYNKTGRFPASIQESFCITMTEVAETDCCSNGDVDCKIWKSTIILPPPIRVNDGTAFAYVGNTNGTASYTAIIPEAYQDIKRGTKFAKLLKYYSYYNGYIYSFNTGNNKKLRVRYVPDNPEELLTLKCDDVPCAQDVKITEDMKKLIKEWIKIELSGKRLSDTEEIPTNGTKES